MKPKPILRSLTATETETLIGWARAEGWNPGLVDALALRAADPDGFIGCLVDGRLAAAISAVRYGKDFGFIGLYISHPDFRGKGYGRKVWDAGMRYLEGRTIGLDGVQEQQANYRSMGFQPQYETFRWSGTLKGSADLNCLPVDEDRIPTILDFDRQFFPSDRSAFLKGWLKPPRIAKARMRGDSVCGYAVARKCHEGHKIGPLFADSTAGALELFQACAAEIGDGTIHIDVPAFQTDFSSELGCRGFRKGFTTTRMYRGSAPTLRSEGIFAITTLELG